MRFLSVFLLTFFCQVAFSQIKTDVIIVGGGASGTMAAIQAARMGVKSVVIEETTWLGGMLTAAGVSAIDGNHRLPSGLWGEFRSHLYRHYGGPEAVETGWVSNTLFEPAVGNNILKEMVKAEENIDVLFETEWSSVRKGGIGWLLEIRSKSGKHSVVEGKVLIDATELGDVMAALKVPYYLGMDNRTLTKETFALDEANDIVQDLTYVITLKDFGKGADKTIKRPKGYNKEEFDGCCDVSDPATFHQDNNDCFKMLTYGRLPNNRYMINWPKKGNDIYLNVVEKNPTERKKMLEEAKQMTLRFVYYIQTELGFRHLGIDYEQYPTKDGFPMIPYHRESRRLQAKSLFCLQHIMTPYDTPEAYYRTGVVVGDYTIDHHHYKYGNAPEIDFVKIRVPSYNVPMGALIPKDEEGLIVAEKSIGVSNIVNGATRLQPVVIGLGQAAGAIAAVSVQTGLQPSQVSIREVQEVLLDYGVYIMPYLDVAKTDPHFKILHKVGSTGILKGVGIPYKWANQTWFYPEREISEYELLEGLRRYFSKLNDQWIASGDPLTLGAYCEITKLIGRDITTERAVAILQENGFDGHLGEHTILNRRWVSVLIDAHLALFDIEIDFNGHFTLNED